jgi:copper chaperone NosL
MTKPVPKLSILTRVALGVCILGILAALVAPLWRFDFFAPQYPGGLWMHIWHDHFEGDIEVINGLNHYIGMKELHPSTFPEFAYIRYIVIGLAALGLLPLVTGRHRWLFLWAALLVAVALLGMYDFWAWEYDYGHNLDPHAPIVNPGMTYQPPLIGYKQLMNFDVYSQPWYGGYALIASIALACLLAVVEWFRFRKLKRSAS